MTAEELLAADADSSIIIKNSGVLADGLPYWAYIAVKPSRYEAFMNATHNNKPVTLEDYGDVLFYGTGTEIPADVQEIIQELYNADDNYMQKLMDEVSAARAEFLQKERELSESRINDIFKRLRQD